MRKGQKSYTKEGIQNALFPLEYMNISQGSGGGFSHEGTKAIDYLGWGNNGRIIRCPYYAPFDCTCVYKSSDGAGVGWRTDKPVMTPTGKRNFTVVFYHDDFASNYKVGDKRKQGELIGHTGVNGYATGDHLHLEIFTGNAYASTSLENWEVLYTNNTVIIEDYGYNWKTTSDSSFGEVVSGNRYLTLAEMTGNAQYIMYYLINEGWTKNAITGMLGNMQVESTINPAIWQGLDSGNMSVGFGLVQWTPASNYINWANANGLKYEEMDSNLKRILFELGNGLQWISTSSYPLSFMEFTQSEESPEFLASAFLKNYERAGVEKENVRRENARYWFDLLDDTGGWTPSPDVPDRNNMLIHLLLADTINGWKF